MKHVSNIKRAPLDQEKHLRELARDRTATAMDIARLRPAATMLMAIADEKVGPAYDLNDSGNILRFRAVWGDEVRWCPNDRGGGMFWWFDRHRWVEDMAAEVPARAWAVLHAMELERDSVIDRVPGRGEKTADEVRKEYSTWVARSVSTSGHHRIVDGLRAQLGMDARAFDHQYTDSLLNTPSTYLDLALGQSMGPMRPWMYVTLSTAAAFDPDATCPRFRAAVDTWMCGRADLVRYLQKLLGAALLPGALGRQLIVLVGPSSANGKSTLGMIMNLVLGDYASTLSADALMEQRGKSSHDEGLAPLVGRRFVFASEGSENLHWDTALVKLLTGGDAISMRRIFRQQAVTRNTWSLWVATNECPQLRNVDPALRDRLRLIPFDHHVPREERIPGLAERLAEEEGSGILNWLLEGLRLVLDEGIGEPPQAVKDLTEDYLEAVDDVGRYLAQCVLRCPKEPQRMVPGGVLYDHYRAWCADEGVDPVSLSRFGKRLDREGIAKGRDAGNRIVRVGIALLTEDAEDVL